jgi:dihydroorotate dehydrogenase
MTPALASAAMPLLRLLDPETAHRAALAGLRAGVAGRVALPADARLATTVGTLRFANPLGLAAGFDKDAVAVRACFALGFGAIEVGTVTLRRQAGNPRPRLFRLPAAGAVINRMGFPNEGWDAVAPRLVALRGQGALPGPLGINIGINKDCDDPAADYATLAAKAAPLADYITVNVSSPNTPGLRDLQSADRLGALLDAVRQAVPAALPVWVKIAPDLDDAALADAVAVVVEKAQALVVSNTTLARPPGITDAAIGEKGGLSGAPLMAPSTAMLAKAHRLARGRIQLVGVGGVASAADVLAKFRAGASLVQLYTALAYDGPALPGKILRDLSARLAHEKIDSIASLTPRDI